MPDENVVHNVEHGSVMLWHHCAELASKACEDLRRQIQDVMAEAGSAGLVGGATRLIAAPRLTLDVQVAAASWGRMLKQPRLNLTELLTFIKEFRNKAPEAGAA